MKYKLTYRIARMKKETEVGAGQHIPSGQVAAFTEEIDESAILQRMKEIETEHNANVKDCPDLPQFAQFLPIEKV